MPWAVIMVEQLHPKRKRILITLGAVFLIAGLGYGVYWLFWGRFWVFTDDAYVNGNLVQLMPQVSGTVVDIYTDDTRLVREGQPLVRLDPTDNWVALQKARADLAQTVRQVRQYFENVRQLQADLAFRKQTLLQATEDFQRRRGLLGTGAISTEEITRYKTAWQNAQSQYDSTLHQLTAAIGLVANSQLYQHPIVVQSKTNFKIAYLNWVRTMISSPATGYVAKRSVQVGQQISTTTPLLAVIPLNEIWVDANYKETQLRRLRIGQAVRLKADMNRFTYHGKIVGLTPGSGNVFAILPPQNATGNWIKIVQRLAVRIYIKPEELQKHPLELGLSMQVSINTRGLKGAVLARVAEEKPLYSTWIFEDQLRHADQEIEAILKNNSPNMSLQSFR